MSQAVKFYPVRTTEARLKSFSNTDGNLYFTVDTGKIYLDAKGKRIPMGGNSGIFYGGMEIPEGTDSDKTDFIFSFDDVEGEQVPNPDDLILNIPDGGFYRVLEVHEETKTLDVWKLPVSGGGGPGGVSSLLKITDAEGSKTKYFTTDAEKLSVKFNVTSSVVEDNYIARISFYRNDLNTPLEDAWEDARDFGQIEYDFTKHINKFSISAVDKLIIRVEDALGSSKSISYDINMIELVVTASSKDSIYYTREKSFDYWYKASGGNNLLNRKVVFKLSDAEGGKLEEWSSNITTSAETNEKIDFSKYEHGIYQLEVKATGQTDNGRTIESNKLISQIINYDTEKNTLLMAVAQPPRTVEQYSTLEIEYLVADDPNSSTGKNLVVMNINGSEITQEIENNKLQKWRVYFDSVGEYNLAISCGDYEYQLPTINAYKYTGEMPVIDETDKNLLLLLKTVGRGNNELNKEVWEYKDAKAKFSNFYWGDINGWMLNREKDEYFLRLTAGAKVDIENFYPFKKDAKESGLTIELDFKVSGVLDFSKPILSCLSYNEDEIQVGFHVTGQESTMNSAEIKATGGTIIEGDDAQDQIYNTAIQGLTTKFTEDERIHLTWVIERNSSSNPLVRTYLNGVLSGMTQYGKDDKFQAINNGNDTNAIIKIDSTYADVDIYNIRVYGIALNAQSVLNNYIATSGTPEDRVAEYLDNNITGDDGKIDSEKVFHNSYKLSIPYIKLTGGTSLDKWKVTNEKEDGKLVYRLPEAKKDYRLMKVEFIDPNDSSRDFVEDIELINTKTGEVVYSPEDATADFEVQKGCQVYGQGTSSMEYPVKNLRIKFKEHEVELYKGAYPVDLICCKADYMESSGSHNTGTANLVYDMYSRLGYKTPAQNFYNKDNWGYDVVTAIRGFPIAIFWSPSGEKGTYEFIGKYNFNMDKATQEPFGFVSYDDNNGTMFGMTGYEEVTYADEKEFKDSILTPYVLQDGIYVKSKVYNASTTYYNRKETIHCFEFLNNASKLDNFLTEGEETFEETFYKDVVSDGKTVSNWKTAFESRYPEDSEDVDSWFEFCEWVNSTENNLQKFKDEFREHLDFNFTCFYYVLTHILLMIDSRAKNLMMATWDNKIWYPIFYDMDTMLGLNNYGYNKFNYTAEDTEANLYNGQASILWNNFRDAFPTEIAVMYEAMRKNGGLTYNELIYNYNQNQANAWNEALANADAYYKYIRPFSEGYYNSVTGDKVWVEPGEKNYLYAGQGRRSMHRQWWLNNRLNYFDGKYLSTQYKFDRFVMRLYTPDSGAEYIRDTSVTADTYQPNTHYIYNADEEIYVLDASESYDANKAYFRKATASDFQGITASASVVKPDNSFTLTPLHDQYLSVAYGGDNGKTTQPVLAKANVATKIENPGGAYIDTETYIYGGSMLKDLGDLSPQYLGKFSFPETTSTKLERLIIGNPHNEYYNPNFSDLSIGSKAPYLEELNIMNCNGLSGRSISIEDCRRIKKVYATGSGVTGISLPKFGVLEELRLPATIKNLILVDHAHLTNNNFTVGSCDYDAVNKEYNYTNDFSRISTIHVENTPIDVYPIIMNSRYLNNITVKGFNWTVTENSLENGVLKTLDVLEKIKEKSSAVGGVPLAASIVGNIHIAIPEAKVNAIDIYNKYWSIFPNVTFTYDEEVLGEFTPTRKITLLNGSGDIFWAKEIEYGKSPDDTFFKSGPNGSLYYDNGDMKLPTKAPSQSHNYEFTGEWLDELTDIHWTIEGLKSLEIEKNYILKPIFNEVLKTFIIEFYNDNVVVSSSELGYGTTLAVPQTIPYKDDSSLPLEKTYGFKGWTDNPDMTLVKNDYELNQALKVVESYTASRNMKFYAVYMEVSVRENVLPENYFRFYLTSDKNGYLIERRYDLSGKITLPTSYQGLPIVGFYPWNGIIGSFQDQTSITHVFWDSNPQISTIRSETFKGCRSLKYIELPKTIHTIEGKAFQNCSLEINDLSWEGLTTIGDIAFGSAFAKQSPRKTLYLSPTIKTLGMNSFSSNSGAFENIQFGAEFKPSQLETLGNSAFYESINDEKYKNFIIYTDDTMKEIWNEVAASSSSATTQKLLTSTPKGDK